MPDLPTPQDAAEATLFSECWDAVLSYADLCTAGSATARQLASEAFSHGIREVRAAEDGGAKNFGRRARPPRLPRIPLLLTAVRQTAATWESKGLGHRLDSDLRLWLNSEKADRYTGPPLHRPLALRGLRDMQEPDAALLWLAEVEAIPLPAVARRLGLDPEGAAEELAQVRGVFRDRCHRNHLDTPLDAECRRYARLLDAVTRSPGADTPDDLSRHLARCVECAEAAACLRLGGGTGLPAALAGGVLGWGGLAYLERRRRAVESGLSRSSADTEEWVPEPEEVKARIGRAGLLVAAVIVSLLALGVSLGAFDSDGGTVARDEPTERQPVGDQVPPTDPLPSATASPAPETSDPDSDPSEPDSGSGSDADEKTPGKEPQSESTSSRAPDPEPEPTKSAYCQASYDVVNQWPDGFQASVTITSTQALDTWRVGWKFRDGQRVTQMWDGSVDQDGSRVTATAADYNQSVPAGGKFGVGFLASWSGQNSAPYDYTLNGHSCTNVS
ncbi:cellulose-binding protein [Streptomyces sp. HC44]|uniref:Cellulose-binding protein n=1 Tax=Streptomyces scabichelini TaxID=2711217 RepID=A0A6G4V7Q4_9ACTN|nr:cellulose-binding domain-containing protein [Streptomyces scabichelini]NGO10148.1 cellulose-binding protein [Streptomyces scabichelini]